MVSTGGDVGVVIGYGAGVRRRTVWLLVGVVLAWGE
jgi:hypothetical protein